MSTAAASVTLHNLLLPQLTFGVIEDNFASVRLRDFNDSKRQECGDVNVSHYSSQHFSFFEHFHKVANNFSWIHLMENNSEGFLHLSRTTLLRTKCWPPWLKDSIKLFPWSSPSITYFLTFSGFIFRTIWTLFPAVKVIHSSNVCIFSQVFHTASIFRG